MKKILGFSLLALVLALPVSAEFINVTTVQQLEDKIYQVFNVVFTFLIIMAVAFIIYAGFKYVTAAGKQETVQEANRMIIFAAAGVLIAIFAKAIPAVVSNILQ
ncbi:MAG: hypothetical protein A2418_02055 [Candidatus Brennerbacteria bacterium RIFOXYC1_FULL_41_11]|uniref:DUF4134 domain-containing protein n=1 Tax=Candidatus Brennerbacteria bacterium RIFOXYD1_FULL_41_16 TaxID=1797529 RepID=A0A1G1XLF0_9BACT|nr:MAG: hypothetical protein A2391_01410 [Candidatus Brennerbacteria bacterium RIFOXYB1_FULL_41_13]OGY39933.1 MAG: hypothetical protein A2418_02055 [Candidatus Brennerbacteria bacterium RIFOXYC1_FULL_41_11]OGY40744.1 MAG: hypothetical protein A2570_01270 [Candidatus Brennerbacteria bacterium RIFOXYD1_FULL_41_16]